MKRIVGLALFFAVFCLVVAASASPMMTEFVYQSSASHSDVAVAPATTTAHPERLMSMPEAPLKKCSFDSDCAHGKCKSGKCGACGFDSECKGWGKCKGGQCGACGFDSECKGFGKCKSGKCSKSPY